MALNGTGKLIVRKIANRIANLGRDDTITAADLPAEDADFAPIWERCRPYTMTSMQRGLALFRAVRYLCENNIAGDFIECGVWRGGSSMIAMLSLRHFGAMDRRVIMFDTFQGMTEPSDADLDAAGNAAADIMQEQGGRPDGILCIASLEEVKANVAQVGYPAQLIEYVVGDIRKTARDFQCRPISLLRLDTDFYDSTKIEIEVLYPHLVSHGVLLIDDYGHWVGAGKAIEEYAQDERSKGRHFPFLNIIDYTGRIATKGA
jgi:O-methyltransferase